MARIRSVEIDDYRYRTKLRVRFTRKNGTIPRRNFRLFFIFPTKKNEIAPGTRHERSPRRRIQHNATLFVFAKNRENGGKKKKITIVQARRQSTNRSKTAGMFRKTIRMFCANFTSLRLFSTVF